MAAITKDPSKPDHYDNRGQTLQKLGRKDEARADFLWTRDVRKK